MEIMGFVFFATEFRPPMGPTQLPDQWVTGTPTPKVKRSEREADRSSPSTAEVKNA
jgi:hypothetical protein